MVFAIAIAKDSRHGEKSEFISDMAPEWNSSIFSIRCHDCFYSNENIEYKNLTEPFIQIEGRGGILWAWNSIHLEMISLYLQGKDISQHEYQFYENIYSWKLETTQEIFR